MDKVASNAIEALKSAPAILAILLFNVVFMGLVVYAVNNERKESARIMELLLQKCVVTELGTNDKL